MRKSITIVLLLWAYSLIAAVPGYVNPVLPYDYSDPDIIRVGDTYLMTSSSFNNVPGLQILVSQDLVHWQIVAAAFDLPANHKPSFLMPCGYAAVNAQPSDHHFSRKPLSETVTYK